MDSRWSSARESPAGTALLGGRVLEHQDAATVSSGQDRWELEAGGAATHRQDAPQHRPGDWALGALASPRKHPDGQAKEVCDPGHPRGHRLWEVPSTAAGGAFHRQGYSKYHGDRESPICHSPTGCEAPDLHDDLKREQDKLTCWPWQG